MEERIRNITFEINDELIKLFGEKVEQIILYGSYARGDFNLESDVDIMILLNCDQKSTVLSEYRKGRLENLWIKQGKIWLYIVYKQRDNVLCPQRH